MRHAQRIPVAVSVNVRELPGALGAIHRHGIEAIEIQLFEPLPWFASRLGRIEKLGARARRLGLVVSTHAPIYDVNPGSPDPFIREYSREILIASLEASAALSATRNVIHTGWNPLLTRAAYEAWLPGAVKTLGSVLRRARSLGVRLCIENFFERDPTPLCDLAACVRGGGIGFCFDLSHSAIFSHLSPESWLQALAPDIAEVHLNDCDGSDDAHLALGQGRNRFAAFFRALTRHAPRAAVVLEMSLPRAWKSLPALPSLPGARCFLRTRGTSDPHARNRQL